MDKHKRFVCDCFLSSYDHKLSYAEVKYLVAQADDEITVWQPYSKYVDENVVMLMDEMLQALLDKFAEIAGCETVSDH